jgi:small subunit ribosomal protein S9
VSETPEDPETTEPEGSAADETPDASTTEAAPTDEPANGVTEGPSDEPAAEAPAAEEPAAEEPAAEAPAAEAPAAEAPTPEQPPAAQAAPPIPAAEPTAEGEQPEEVEIAPRQKPEIPGADLEPDLLPEAEQYLDAEAQAAAEAEAEAAAERARAEAEDEQSQPIADAAIDLAAGARYTATGKRKTAVARVILKPGAGTYSINGKPLDDFFPRETLQRMIRQPLETVGYDARMDVIARMHGGGVSSQAGALRHGISRALIVADPNLRGELKRRGYLTRDPRVKERKKAGLKKARKRPQFSKR